jgi:hypothetical protein
VVLYAARLVAQKQPKVMAQTLLRLAQQGQAFQALVAGVGPELPWLQDYIRKNGLAGRVRLLGAADPEQMRRLLAAADILFLPSQWEGIALALYEAMAAGLAVVAADVGGQRELVTPECGLLLPRAAEATEVEQYAGALAGLLADPARRQALGAAGRARVEAHFRLAQMGERMADCLARAVALAREQPRAAPDVALGQLVAREAVEYMRLCQVADQLWAERHGLAQPARSGDWRRDLYQRLYRWHEPIYHWYTRHGFGWLTPLREAVKRLLLRAASSSSRQP